MGCIRGALTRYHSLGDLYGWKSMSQFWILEVLGQGLPLGAWWRPTGDIFTRQWGECGLTGRESLDEGSRPLRVSSEIWGSRPTPRGPAPTCSGSSPFPAPTDHVPLGLWTKPSLPEVTLVRVFCTATERRVTTRLSYYMVLLLPPTSYNLTS